MSTDLDEIGRFRPNLRPLVLAVVANLLFGGGLLGVPYLRGQERAEASAGAFARFAACLFDGETVAGGGLALPRGERTRFATLALTDEAWPGRCRSALAQIAHEPAFVLFPAVKSAEHEVRGAVVRVERALTALERARRGGRVAEALLIEVARLQAFVAAQVRGARIDVDPMRPAITLRASTVDLPAPSIVPLRAGEGGPFELGLENGALFATAMDARVIGHARVDTEGSVDPRIARRRPLVSAVVGGRETPWVLWTTAQCGDDRCAQRATGIAPLVQDGQRLTPRAWLRAHPIGAPRASVHVDGDAAWIAAVGEPGRLALRRFSLPSNEPGEPEQVTASVELEVSAEPEVVRFVPGAPPALVWAGEGAGLMRPGGRPVPIGSPGGHVLLSSCGSAEDGWIGLASQRGVRVHRADGSGERVIEAQALPPEPGALRVVCGAGGADVLIVREGELLRSRCGADGCSAPATIASGVDRFDAVRLGPALLVAWSTGGPSGPVRVTRIEGGEVATQIPAACWEPASGLCGAPRLGRRRRAGGARHPPRRGPARHHERRRPPLARPAGPRAALIPTRRRHPERRAGRSSHALGDPRQVGAQSFLRSATSPWGGASGWMVAWWMPCRRERRSPTSRATSVPWAPARSTTCALSSTSPGTSDHTCRS